MALTAEEIQEIHDNINGADTVGDLMKVFIAEVDNEERLKECMKAYVHFLHLHNPDKTFEECVKAGQSNIGYLVGYYDDSIVVKVRKMLELAPVFLGGAEVILFTGDLTR